MHLSVNRPKITCAGWYRFTQDGSSLNSARFCSSNINDSLIHWLPKKTHTQNQGKRHLNPVSMVRRIIHYWKLPKEKCRGCHEHIFCSSYQRWGRELDMVCELCEPKYDRFYSEAGMWVRPTSNPKREVCANKAQMFHFVAADGLVFTDSSFLWKDSSRAKSIRDHIWLCNMSIEFKGSTWCTQDRTKCVVIFNFILKVNYSVLLLSPRLWYIRTVRVKLNSC